MVKKILGIVAGCVILLLTLLFFLLLLIQYQDFFGQAITWVLCACVVILMLFVLYVMISWLVDAAKKNKHDEDNLSEKSLEQLLSSSAPDAFDEALSEHAQHEAKAVEPKSEQPGIDTKTPKNQTGKDVKVGGIKSDNTDHAKGHVQPDKSIIDAESTGAFPIQQVPQPAPLPADTGTQASTPTEEQARKAQAVASTRKQAEAAAAARRRAAQTAARTQAFAALDANNLPVIEARPMPVVAPSPASKGGESIWEKMDVRQSAAPQLSPRTATAQFTTGQAGAVPQTGSAQGMPRQTASFTAQNSSVQATGNVYRTQTIPVLNADGTVRAQTPRAAMPQTAQVPVQGRPVMRVGQPVAPPMGTAQMRPVPVHSMPRPTAQIPIQGRPVAGYPVGRPGQPLPPYPPQNTMAIPVPVVTAPVPVTEAATVGGTEGTSPAPTKVAQPPQTAEKPIASKQEVPSTAKAADDKKSSSTSVVNDKDKTKKETSSSVKKDTDTGAGKEMAKEEAAAPVKRPRGRPPKPKDPEEENKPKRPRGRPPKPKDPEEENKPKRPRGRPPKPKDPAEENKPKRPRGRPRKHPLPEEAEAAQEQKDAKADNKKQA